MKRLRWFLYVLAAVALGFYISHAVSQSIEKKAFAKFHKDLFITKVTSTKAPDFKLRDQNGKMLSLSNLKGKKVLLQFMDPKCTDVCPLISQEIIDANKKLGSDAKHVVYIGINVNEYHNKLSDVQTFSKLHGLSNLSNWYFLTGTPQELKRVWKAYHIDVVPNKDGDVQHTSAVYFINKQGEEVYMGEPENDNTSVLEWANAMSFVLKRIS